MTRTVADTYAQQARASGHGEHWSGPPQMIEQIAEVVGTDAHERVLDIGCGVGGPARRLAAHVGCRVVAADLLAPVALEAARRDGPGGVRFLAASASHLPFRAQVFGQVWCLGVIAHVADRARAVREFARVLVPGGVVCFTEAFWDGVRRPRFADVAPVPWSALTVDELAETLRAGGFPDVIVHDWPGHPAWDPATVRDAHLHADFLDARLAPAMVVGRAAHA